MYSEAVKLKARRMRQAGVPLRQVARAVGIGYRTAQVWLRGTTKTHTLRCDWCGGPFEWPTAGSQRKFCSSPCQLAIRSAYKRAKRAHIRSRALSIAARNRYARWRTKLFARYVAAERRRLDEVVHREAERDRQRRLYVEDPERIRQKARNYRRRYPERKRAQTQAWIRAHPIQWLEISRRSKEKQWATRWREQFGREPSPVVWELLRERRQLIKDFQDRASGRLAAQCAPEKKPSH